MILFTLVVGGIIGIGGMYFYESSMWQTRAATRNVRTSTKQLAKLRKQLTTIEKYHNNQLALAGYLMGQMLLAFSFWLVGGLASYITYVYNSSRYTFNVFFTEPTFFSGAESAEAARDSFNEQLPTIRAWAVIDAVQVIVTFMLTFAAFAIAFRSYRTWRKVARFEDYQSQVNQQISTLESKLGNSHNTENAQDSEGRVP